MLLPGAAPGCLLREGKLPRYCASPEQVAERGGGGGGGDSDTFFFIFFHSEVGVSST